MPTRDGGGAVLAPSARSLIASAAEALRRAGVEEPRRESQALLAHTCGLDRAQVLVRGDWVPGGPEAALFGAVVARRARREPFAYLVGRRWWLDFDLEVDRNVLIPRPETEALAALALRACEERAAIGMGCALVADVGTGSGALAIAIARAFPAAWVVGTDSSAAALRTAARNVARLAPGRVALRACDLLEGVGEAADLVVANLPYIPSRDLDALEPELAYEPRGALDGGADGLEAIRALVAQLPGRLASGATVLLECGHDQGERVRALIAAALPAARTGLHRDLAGIERFVEARIL